MSLAALDNLIQDAAFLADADAYVRNGRHWEMDGGRDCPHGQSEAWPDACSQPVFVDRVNGDCDYGERGGPGYHWCATECTFGHRDKFNLRRQS